ncbi:pro-MCH [Xenopus laevis]|uniref:Pro-MCH n=2 Tax=Xenopus laevis TaxID=8355 RepID=A0A1L8GY36_XENLA|nr:pro-MCH [Xenopus laevis]OCT88750.1 hypothetical protein XELAEV_18017380mg [Xenopus laevis]
MVRMIHLGHPFLIALSLLSQGFLFAVSKSIRKAETDDLLLDTITLRKAFRNGDTLEKPLGDPNNQYNTDGANILNEEEERNMKTIDPQQTYLSPDGLPLNIGIKQMPYFAFRNSLHHPESEDQNSESTQERRDIGDEENAAKFPVGRRDFDMLRCMLGRVYRPCWQI